MLPSLGYKDLLGNAITGKFTHTSANHEQSSVNIVVVRRFAMRVEPVVDDSRTLTRRGAGCGGHFACILLD